MKTVIQLDADGFFAGFTTADESPLEPGVFHLPAGSVDAGNPPELTGKERAQWDGKRWAIVQPEPEPEPEPEPTAAEQLAQARAAVNAERDRRLGTTFTFAGKSYDCDTASLARITGAATLAGFAMGAGAAAGNLRWHGGAADFTWIAADNTLTTMDAQTCFAFGNAAATNQSAHIFAGRTVKAMDPIPSNYTDDKYWP